MSKGTRKVTLKLVERLNLLPIMEKKGTLTTVRIIKEINEKIGLSSEELARVTDPQNPDRLDAKMVMKHAEDEEEIELTGHAFKMIEDTLRKKDTSAELDMSLLSVWDIFCGQSEPDDADVVTPIDGGKKGRGK